MSGVNPAWIAGTDFIMVHRGLVAALGGDYEAAMVLDRIHFRSGRDGWWAATATEMQEETCLSEWKLKAAKKHLVDAGFIESERIVRWEPDLKWRVILLVPEESSDTSGMNSSSKATLTEESSDTVREESSISSTKNAKNNPLPTSSEVTAPEAPQEHPSRAITRDWLPSGGFHAYLRETYPRVDLDRRIREFVLWYLSRKDTCRSWEARLETWISRDQAEAEAELREGTDDMGIPHSQRKTSVVQPAKPGDSDYVHPDDLIL